MLWYGHVYKTEVVILMPLVAMAHMKPLHKVFSCLTSDQLQQRIHLGLPEATEGLWLPFGSQHCEPHSLI